MLISNRKKNYLREYFQENYNNSKKVWIKINELLYNKHKKSSEVFINEQDCIIAEQEIVANKLNYFVNVAQNLLKGLGKANNKFQDYLKKKTNKKSFFPKEIDH